MRAGAAERPRGEPAARAARASEGEWVQRFTIGQVLQHGVLMVSFTGLALTGIPQKYAQLAASRWLIEAMGGIERVRVVHHWLGLTLLALAGVHLLDLLVRAARYGLRTEMWPSADDARALLHQLRYFMGLETRPVAFGRYSFKEKFEYWAVVWGTAVMGLTGLILLYPERATRFLPGVAVPAARAAHGGEAVLAVLAILIWHMYNAHLRPEVFPLDPVIFTGRMPRERALEEHPLEFAHLAPAEPPSVKPGRGGGPSTPHGPVLP